MGTEHLLLGIMSMDNSTGAKMIRDEGATLEEVEKALNKAAVEVPGSDMAMMSLSEAVILTLRMAQNYTREQGLMVIGTEHILYALLTGNGLSFIYDIISNQSTLFWLQIIGASIMFILLESLTSTRP